MYRVFTRNARRANRTLANHGIQCALSGGVALVAALCLDKAVNDLQVYGLGLTAAMGAIIALRELVLALDDR